MNRNFFAWGPLLTFLWLATSHLKAQSAPPGSEAPPGSVPVAVPPSGQTSVTNSKPGAEVFTLPVEDVALGAAMAGETNSEALAQIKVKAEKGDKDAQLLLFRCYEVEKDHGNALHWLYEAANQGQAEAEFYAGMCCVAGITNATVSIPDNGPTNEISDSSFSNPGVVDWIRKSAEHGYADAQFALGGMYERGLGLPISGSEAVNWLRKAADQGSAEAELSLGRIFSEGKIVPKNVPESIKWYRKSAEQGSVFGQLALARIYYYGIGAATNYSEALKWLGNAETNYNGGVAAYQLGSHYSNLASTTNDLAQAAKDYHVALGLYLVAAEDGFGPAAFRLAEMYDDGIGVPKDPEKSADYYSQAMDWDGWRGTNAYGGKLECNELYGEDFNWAFEYQHFLARMEHASPEMQFKFGMTFRDKKDSGEAERWFRKAGERGDSSAALSLASTYRTGTNYAGQVVPKDIKEALKWLDVAANHGHPEASLEAGQIYEDGNGVPKDEAEAARWYLKAASQKPECKIDEDIVNNAQGRIAYMYQYGKGVPQDYVEAYKWWNLAAAGGNRGAGYFRDLFAAQMTPDQIAEAQKLSREFKPRQVSESDSTVSDGNALGSIPSATGTGFFITDDGYLISNYHVAKDATKVRLLTSAGLINAKVVQVDAANDLALLKADGRFAPLPIAASRTVALGGTVATVGFPDIGLQGFAPKLAKGEIASLSGAGDDPRYFQISVPVQPGNSGGALVDERGNVIGIVSAKLDAGAALAASGALPENVNYAVKSSFLLSFLESVPAVSAMIKAPNTKEERFEDVVKSAQDAAALVLVY
ncbi:MAG: tetratricopeptide repeat-containing serine protease family protein [Verrucomicrobiota bacterium]|jgi:TPR repeat protein